MPDLLTPDLPAEGSVRDWLANGGEPWPGLLEFLAAAWWREMMTPRVAWRMMQKAPASPDKDARGAGARAANRKRRGK